VYYDYYAAAAEGARVEGSMVGCMGVVGVELRCTEVPNALRTLLEVIIVGRICL
jgi:hypothetical protein